LEGGIAGATIDNRYKTGALTGNESSPDTISASLGAGVRFTFLEPVSVAPTFGLIYSHTENEFNARTDADRALRVQFDGSRPTTPIRSAGLTYPLIHIYPPITIRGG
jgi:hypothetical protein